jgi:hypothetical protein
LFTWNLTFSTRRWRTAAAGGRRQEISWQIVRSGTNPKPSAWVQAESPSRVAQLIIWVSGEAELIHAELEPRVTDPTVDIYEITTLLGLNGALDDLERHMEIGG